MTKEAYLQVELATLHLVSRTSFVEAGHFLNILFGGLTKLLSNAVLAMVKECFYVEPVIEYVR